MPFDNLIEIENKHPIIIDMVYAKAENISGKAVYCEIGFGNKAYVHKDMWACIKKLYPILQEKKLCLKITDAYRPPSAHRKLLQAVPLEGLFAISPEASQHCHGTAIDVILCNQEGDELEFQSPIDCYTPYYAKELQCGRDKEYKEFLQTARHDYNKASSSSIANRKLLKELMESIGLETIPHEWWHYNLPNGKSNKYPVIDF